jgi:hypothetical protein
VEQPREGVGRGGAARPPAAVAGQLRHAWFLRDLRHAAQGGAQLHRSRHQKPPRPS